MKITNFFLNRRYSALALITALFVLGIYGYSYLPVDFLPNITYPMIKIHIWWRGATPEEIDKNLADPIERQVSTVDDLDYIESSSIEGMYTLLVNFRYGTDVNVCYQDVLAAMARVSRELPKDIDPPVVIKADPSQLPVVQLTISSDLWDLTKLRTWVEEWLQNQMIAVPGVAGTEVVGGLKREIRIHLDPLALEKFGLNISKLAKIIEEENIEQFGGRVIVGKREIIARTMGEFTSLDQIRNLVILNRGNSNVYLKDVAEVVDGHEEVRVITRLNQKPSVKLSVLKQSSANTVEVSKAVLKKIKDLESLLPDGVKLGVVENQSEYIEDALNGVKNTAFQAAILVILIVWAFLGSFRQMLVIVIALPLTLIFNFALMKIMGFSLNIFSLGGLVIAIGILVDNSIIVIETASQKMSQKGDKTVNQMIGEAAAEIGPALVAGTLSFLALFVPFLLVPGLLSLLFKELILVITGIVLISLFMAVTITPLLTATFFRKGAKRNTDSPFIRFFNRLNFTYQNWVGSLCRHNVKVVIASVAILVVAALLAPSLGYEFLPQLDDGRVMVKVKLPTGTALEQINLILENIEDKLTGMSEIDSIFTLAGGRVWGLYTYEVANEGELDIQLVPPEKRKLSTKQFIQKIRPLVSSIPVPGGKAMVMQMKVKGIRKIGDADIELKLRGDNLEQIFDLARKTASTIGDIKELTNVVMSMDMTKPEFQIYVDRQKAAAFGVSVAEVSRSVRSLITGAVASRFRDNTDYYNIRLMIPETKMVSKSDIERLPLLNSAGKNLKIADVAQIKMTTGPVEIVRENQTKQIIVRTDAADTSVGKALDVLKERMNKLQLPPGVELEYGGQAQMISNMIDSVIRILALAFLLSFLVLVFQFNNLRIPFMIIAGIPFCLSGIAFIMVPTGFPIGATVLIGLIVIFAAAVNDGVLLYTYADELRESENLPACESVVKAAGIRLRPRIMTTLSTLVGFIPLAIGFETGAGMLQPMAVAAIGGLLMEIIVALFLMPCFYVLVNRSKSNEISI